MSSWFLYLRYTSYIIQCSIYDPCYNPLRKCSQVGFSLSIFVECVHIKHNDCLKCVNYNMVSDHHYDLGIKGQGHIDFNLESVYSLIHELLFHF